MFVRGLVVSVVFAWLSPLAQADEFSQQQAAAQQMQLNSIVGLHQQLQSDFLATATTLQYGYTPNGYGDTFGSRNTWQDLRLRTAGSSRMTGTRLLLSRTATARAPVRIRVNPGRVGGLGRQISSGSPSVSLHGITSGSEGSGSAPSFGSLHEGNSSFSFGGTSPGAQ